MCLREFLQGIWALVLQKEIREKFLYRRTKKQKQKSYQKILNNDNPQQNFQLHLHRPPPLTVESCKKNKLI